MQLIYNGTDLAQLGVLRILGRSARREPAEAPNRERIEYRVRLDFFQPDFATNFAQVQSLVTALATNAAALTWVDGTGATLLSRPVTAGEDEIPRDCLERGGTSWQAIEFSFWYYNHAVLSPTLSGRYQRLGGAPQDLGAVEGWTEKLAATRQDELRSNRKLVTVSVSVTGRWLGDTTLPVASRQTALLAKKDALMAELLAKAEGTLTFGSFNQTVRVQDFAAEVNQAQNAVQWQATFTATRYPNEADYALIDLKVQKRQHRPEGVNYLTLTGTLKAPSEAAATLRLNALTAALVPADYALLDTDITPASVVSETTGGTGDGTAFVEISFTLAYRDTAGIACTYQRAVSNAPAVDLGTVDKFGVRQSSTLFDELRSARKRAAGAVTLAGKWYAPETLSDAAKQTVLLAQLTTLQTELARGAAGSLAYGAAFNQVVRVLDFDAELDKLTNVIEWSLSASYTAYPNEADYAIAQLMVGTRENPADGTVFKTLNGTIGAQSPEAAYAKLVRLRAALIPSGYVLQSDSTEERRVSTESGLATTGQNQGDGDAFIELTIADVWQAAVVNVLEWSLRTATEDDVKSPTRRITYAGTVRAAAPTQVAAFAAAAVQASVLGDGKFPLRLSATLTTLDKLFQTTSGQIAVTVEFSYVYETASAATFLEMTSTLAAEAYGSSTETVSGSIAAPSLALAAACYASQVRGLAGLAGALLLSERTPTLSQQVLVGVASLDQRYEFSLQVLRPKAAGQNAIRYDVQVTPDFRSLELSTTVAGTVWSDTQANAEAFLQALLTGLGLTGKVVANPRTPHSRTGPQTGGSGPATVFESMDFSVTLISLFTGVSGILECEASEEFVYSANRNVEKMIPDGVSIIQQCGITCGGHTVTARCRATTATAASAWVKGIRTALLLTLNGSTVPAYEDPPRIGTRYGFLPQVAGVPAGSGANVTVYEVSGSFSERVPELVMS